MEPKMGCSAASLPRVGKGGWHGRRGEEGERTSGGIEGPRELLERTSEEHRGQRARLSRT
eukprot:5943613-Pyramimonas_sp.AAC.1